METIMAMEGTERLDGFDTAREVWVFAPWGGKSLDDHLVIPGHTQLHTTDSGLHWDWPPGRAST